MSQNTTCETVQSESSIDIDSSIELIDTSNYSVSKFYDEETLIEDANANTEDKNDEDYVDKSSKPSPAKKPRKAERRKKDKSTKTNSQNDDLEKIALGCDLCHPEGRPNTF